MTTATDPQLADRLTLDHGPGWANRFALAPLTNTQSHPDGTLSDAEHDWLVARGRGGFGLTMTCAAYATPAGKAWQGQLGISSDEHLPGLTRLADSLRATGTTSSVQLHHGGRRADASITGEPLACPWDEPDRGVTALTTAEVEQVVADFVAAAVRAEQAGFDGVEVHGAHGYLLCQFLDARRDRRTDRYGGSLDGRLQVFLEVLSGIRDATGPDFQLGLRLTPEGNGITLPDGREIARRLLASGTLDYLDMSLWDVFMKPRGQYDDWDEWDPERLLIDHFTDLPRHGALLGVAGKVLSAADARWCLERGADFVSVGTGAILHHDFAARSVGDTDFRARPMPAPREVLAGECVSERFLDYLSVTFDDVVA
ncbi:NADH:flavin oxidoreductase [Nocardioides caeni]|uniref:NADH:flavin oxidoreductase n=1 Tax=Nocardioides caeni TaxID=574700 RepID=A0A4S8MZP0_9ACTN|nr:NADH:flavin oxidoreductase [Nocardioides caeni]THV08913.1 NADH:flavin oxidoreductase [Nocardioides caeni]